MAYNETTGQVIGAGFPEEEQHLPAMVNSRSYMDLADAVRRPEGVDIKRVENAASSVATELGNEITRVDVNAMVIAGINQAKADRL